MHLPKDVLHAAVVPILLLVGLLIIRSPDESWDLPAQVLRQILVEQVDPQWGLGLLYGLATIAQLVLRGRIVLGEEAVVGVECREDGQAPG